MVSKRLNAECLNIKDASRTDVKNPWQSSGKLASVAEVILRPRQKRVGCPTFSVDCGKWLDEGTVPHRVGAPDPNVLSIRNIGCKSENIGDCSDDMCNGEMVEFLTLHSSMDHLPAYGAIERTPHTTGLIRQQVTR